MIIVPGWIMWACRRWKLFGVGLLILAIGLQTWRLSNAREALEDERTAHAQFRSDVEKASAEARRRNAEQVLRIERDQDTITQEVSRDYQDRIAELNRRIAALRLRPSTGNQGSARNPEAGPVPESPGGADDPAQDSGLSTEERIIATEQAIQLDALQQWIRRQQGVNREE